MFVHHMDNTRFVDFLKFLDENNDKASVNMLFDTVLTRLTSLERENNSLKERLRHVEACLQHSPTLASAPSSNRTVPMWCEDVSPITRQMPELQPVKMIEVNNSPELINRQREVRPRLLNL